MFQLSQTHNQAFQAKAEADFVREVIDYLLRQHSETFDKIPNNLLKLWILQGLLRAAKLGVSDKGSIICFLLLLRIYPNFDNEPILQKFILTFPKTPNENIFLLAELITNDKIFSSDNKR